MIAGNPADTVLEIGHGIFFSLRIAPLGLGAFDYPDVTAEPQKSGWPLTADECA